MKSDTLNTFLYVVLAVLIIAIGVCSIQGITLAHKARSLSATAMQAQKVLQMTGGLLGELDAYNKRQPTPEITAILKSFQVKPAAH